MSRSSQVLAGLFGAISLAVACSATPRDTLFGEGEGGSDGGEGAGSAASAASAEAASSGDINLATTGAGGSTGIVCTSPPNADEDMDGFTGEEGDCNDCDPNVNPGAIDVAITEPGGDGTIPEPSDEDCDGEVDNVLPTCDDAIALDDTDPLNGARVIDICQQASPGDKKWGLLSSTYVRADGAPLEPSTSVGVFERFGPNVNAQGGKRMLALSSGHARILGQPDACGQLSCSTSGSGSPPPGFPQDVPSCPGLKDISDDVGLEIKLRAPKNATGYSFNFDFYSFEFPEWICKAYNDQFIALVSPPPVGSIDGNIAFDTLKNPVSVNIAFFEVCSFDLFHPQFPCALGPAELQGTGFDVWDEAGATSWLKTTAPIGGGEELTIRFATWDTGDDAYDSTVLIDNFQWIATGGVNVSTEVVPDPL